MTDKTQFDGLLAMMQDFHGEIGQEMTSANPYIRRDLGGMALTMQAYLLAGYAGEPCAYGEEVPPPTGWFEVMDEETSHIYHDGVKVARMSMSCRGGAYHASLWLAANDNDGTRHPEMEMYASNDLPYWRPKAVTVKL